MQPVNLHKIHVAALASLLIITPGQTPHLMEVDAAAEGQAKRVAQPQETPPETSATQAAAPSQASELASSVSAEETCIGKTEGSACWMELENRPECYLWIYSLRVNETAAWTGACTEGLAEGDGEIYWVWGSDRGNRAAREAGATPRGLRDM